MPAASLSPSSNAPTNVRTFLDDLRVKREELASVGVEISEDDYRSTIINFLPFSLSQRTKPLPLIP